MTLLKILWYFFTSAFTLKYRQVSVQLSKDGTMWDVYLWGVATNDGWKILTSKENVKREEYKTKDQTCTREAVDGEEKE